MLSLFAESLCLVDGKHNIIPLIVPEEQEFMHFNTLWCYLFYKLTGEDKEDKGIDAFKIIQSKGLTITALLDRVFPAIAATDNKPLPFVTTKTVAYIFALVIDSVTIFHQEFPNSRALQHEASILQALNDMPADEFRTELRDTLTDFYKTFLLRSGAGGRPVAKDLISKFKVKAAPAPEAADADAADAVQNPAAAAAAAPQVGEPAAEEPAPAPVTPPVKGAARGKGAGARSGKIG